MFYEELKQKREKLGITIDQLVARTKITKEIFQSFEAGDFSRLPKTYTRLFLKAYAQELGEDPNHVLQALEEYLGTPTNLPTPTQNAVPEKKLEVKNATSPLKNLKHERNFISILVFLIIIIFLIAVLKQIFIDEPLSTPGNIKSSGTGTPSLPDTALNIKQDSLKDSEKFSPLNLVILTKDSCWIKIITDNQDTFESNLPPHYKKEIRATEQFDVRIGRPGEVNLILNGRDLGPVGDPSIPTRVIIKKEGIVRRQSFSTR